MLPAQYATCAVVPKRSATACAALVTCACSRMLSIRLHGVCMNRLMQPVLQQQALKMLCGCLQAGL